MGLPAGVVTGSSLPHLRLQQQVSRATLPGTPRKSAGVSSREEGSAREIPSSCPSRPPLVTALVWKLTDIPSGAPVVPGEEGPCAGKEAHGEGQPMLEGAESHEARARRVSRDSGARPRSVCRAHAPK